MGCLDDNTVLEMVAGRLPPLRQREALDHIDTCAHCRGVIAVLAKTSPDSQLPPAPRVLQIGDLVAGRYMLERPIGSGGMGVVWAARRTEDGAPVALKVLRGSTPETARRLVREARIAIALFHPNIARVFEVVGGARGGDDPVLVMELLRGESFDVTLAREGRLRVEPLSRILLEVCSALAAAHAHGVVHRDLKPSNIFLTHESVKVLDFGIAKLLGGPLGPSTDLTRSGMLLGTPHFMAPEQAYGESDIDARADIWSLGVILYLALSGRLPVQGKALGEIFRVLTVGRIPPLLEVAGDVPPTLAALVMRLLTRARDERPGDVGIVVRELEKYTAAR